jgi:hypothetical protein
MGASCRRARRAFRLEALERRELLATATIFGELYKLVPFTISDGSFSGSTVTEQAGTTTYQDNYVSRAGTQTDSGFIQYLNPTTGIGGLNSSSGQGTGQDSAGPYAYSYSNGISVLRDDNGVLTRTDSSAQVTPFDAADPRSKNTPFGFDSAGTIAYSATGAQAQTSWNVTTPGASGATTTSTGAWSGTLVFPETTTDLQLSNAGWNLGNSAFVRFSLPGRVLPTSSRLTPVSDVRVFWSSSQPGDPNPQSDTAVIAPVPIYWNHDSGLLQIDDLPAPPAGANSLVFVIDSTNQVDDSIDNPGNNVVSLPLPEYFVTSGTGTLNDNRFSFGVDSGGTATGQITVKNVSSSTKSITNITVDGKPLDNPPTLPAQIAPNGSFTFNINVSDLEGATTGTLVITTSTGPISIPIEALVNTPPVISAPNGVNVSSAVGSHVLSLDVQDFDSPQQTLTFSKVSGPAEVTIDANGTLTWTKPATLPASSYSFTTTVRVTDNGFPPQASEVTLTYYVNGPQAQDDSAITPPGTAVTFSLLGNDLDADGIDANSVQLNLVQSNLEPTRGTVVDTGNGSVQYTPEPGFVGTDSFSYYVQDSLGVRSNLAVVTVYVTNNQPPTNLQLSSATVRERVSGAVIGTLSASDPDGSGALAFSVSDSRFDIVGQQLKLKAGASLLASEGPISLEITATDSGDPPLSVKRTFVLTVQSNPAPWQNPDDHYDVDHDSDVDVRDAIYVIRRLRQQATQLAFVYPAGDFYPDVNASGDISVLDAIDVIREVRRRRALGSGGEGESSAPYESSTPSSSTAATDLALASLAFGGSDRKRAGS